MNDSWLDRNRSVIFTALLFAAASGATIFYLRQPAQAPIELQPSVEATATATPLPSPTPIPIPAPVRVYVTGAVVNSDVYFLPAGSIVKDAILAADGFTPDADLERINQALELKDQQQIHVPRLGEENAPPPIQGGASPENNNNPTNDSVAPLAGGLININTATLGELDSLPGIGPAIAQRIIDYRENADGFKTIEEIREVSGIGEATFAKIKDLIAVE